MHPQFGQLMAEATALTRAGDLQAAMAAITAALNGSPDTAPQAPHPDVVDVIARVVEDPVPPTADRRTAK